MSSVVVMELTLIDVLNAMQCNDFICVSIKHPVCNVLRGNKIMLLVV